MHKAKLPQHAGLDEDAADDAVKAAAAKPGGFRGEPDRDLERAGVGEAVAFSVLDLGLAVARPAGAVAGTTVSAFVHRQGELLSSALAAGAPAALLAAAVPPVLSIPRHLNSAYVSNSLERVWTTYGSRGLDP